MFFKAIAAMVAADLFDRHMREKQLERIRRRDDAPHTGPAKAQPASHRLVGRDWSAPERPN